jgi:hypothetical protein
MAREFITTTPAHIASAVATNSGMHARRTAILPAAKMPWGIFPPTLLSLVQASLVKSKKGEKKTFYALELNTCICLKFAVMFHTSNHIFSSRFLTIRTE